MLALIYTSNKLVDAIKNPIYKVIVKGVSGIYCSNCHFIIDNIEGAEADINLNGPLNLVVKSHSDGVRLSAFSDEEISIY